MSARDGPLVHTQSHNQLGMDHNEGGGGDTKCSAFHTVSSPGYWWSAALQTSPFVYVDICNNHYLETIYIVNVNIVNMHVSLGWVKKKTLVQAENFKLYLYFYFPENILLSKNFQANNDATMPMVEFWVSQNLWGFMEQRRT